ncbi:MAG: hypothetical protein QG597_3614 [Actinomycetota bacterium]|nr:hypothetical protein [Actinomycetota bacterium]
MSGTYPVGMGDRGTPVVPADLRERAEMREGSAVIFVQTEGGLLVLTRDQLKERVRQDLASLDLVSHLLAERRAESASGSPHLSRPVNDPLQ